MKQFYSDKSLKFLSATTLLALIFFLIVQGISAISEIRIKEKSVNLTNVITFNGVAEVSVIPDVANFTITVREVEKDALAAQQKAADKANKLLALLQESGADKKDIQTKDYNAHPKYVYKAEPCVKNICPPGKPVLEGYEASQTITAKLRDIQKAGEILSKVAVLKIYEVSGPDYAISDLQKYKSQAQAKAIEDAKGKAQITARNLGVKLKKIVRFYENSQMDPVRSMAVRTMALGASSPEVAPAQFESGEEKVSATVAITYEIEQ